MLPDAVPLGAENVHFSECVVRQHLQNTQSLKNNRKSSFPGQWATQGTYPNHAATSLTVLGFYAQKPYSC